MARITFEDLGEIRKKRPDKKIVFCSGSFDLVHAGHVLFFEDAKRQGDVLVVMIGGDEVIKKLKGASRPVLNEHVRSKMVDSVKPVDYVLIDHFASEDHPPFHAIKTALGKLRPDVWVVNQDAFEIPRREEVARKFGVHLLILPRTAPAEFERISTTSIIEKIKNLL